MPVIKIEYTPAEVENILKEHIRKAYNISEHRAVAINFDGSDITKTMTSITALITTDVKNSSRIFDDVNDDDDEDED